MSNILLQTGLLPVPNSLRHVWSCPGEQQLGWPQPPGAGLRDLFTRRLSSCDLLCRAPLGAQPGSIVQEGEDGGSVRPLGPRSIPDHPGSISWRGFRPWGEGSLRSTAPPAVLHSLAWAEAGVKLKHPSQGPAPVPAPGFVQAASLWLYLWRKTARTTAAFLSSSPAASALL